MTTTIDQIFAKVMRLNGAPVLCVAPHVTNFQHKPSTTSSVFLLTQRVDPDHHETWGLPSADEIEPDPDACTSFGDVLLARCDEQFQPTPWSKYCWMCPDLALSCASTDPRAVQAIKDFLAGSGDHQATGASSMESRSEFMAAQKKCDEVCQAFGGSAPPPLQGEGLLGYRQRLAAQFQSHSKEFKTVDLSKVNCPVAMGAVEDRIYSAAMDALESGATTGPGKMRPVIKMDGAGRPITRYVASDDGACWDAFNPPIRYVTNPKWLGMAPRR